MRLLFLTNQNLWDDLLSGLLSGIIGGGTIFKVEGQIFKVEMAHQRRSKPAR